MSRIDKLILGLASAATLAAFLLQCPAQADRAFCTRFTAVPDALGASGAMPLVAAIAVCSFVAMLLSTALHHKTRRRHSGRHSVGRARSLAGELAWVAIPIVIVVGVAIPASGLLDS